MLHNRDSDSQREGDSRPAPYGNRREDGRDRDRDRGNDRRGQDGTRGHEPGRGRGGGGGGGPMRDRGSKAIARQRHKGSGGGGGGGDRGPGDRGGRGKDGRVPRSHHAASLQGSNGSAGHARGKDEVEDDPHRLAQRQKQIDFGKNTVGYDNYIKAVPKDQRTSSQPRTPDKTVKCSKRQFQGRIKLWRQELHKWDVKEGEDGEDLEDLEELANEGFEELGLTDWVEVDGDKAADPSDRVLVLDDEKLLYDESFQLDDALPEDNNTADDNDGFELVDL